jgi:hypothetical protein
MRYFIHPKNIAEGNRLNGIKEGLGYMIAPNKAHSYPLGAIQIIRDTLGGVAILSPNDTGRWGGQTKCHMSFFVHFKTKFSRKSLTKLCFL